jgi:carboxymethylenebutenolidase
VAKNELIVKTADGNAKASYFAPRSAGQNESAGVIVYTDAFGPRPAMDDIAERLIDQGYSVLVPDLFYRFGSYGPFDAKTAMNDERTRNGIMRMIRSTSQQMTQNDTASFISMLTEQGVTGKIGTVGYCMGGSRAINAAAAYPDRIAAAASFHGGNLASDAADSPHRNVSTIKGRVYVASAGVDPNFPPEQSARLAEALRVAEVDHIIENYPGKAHGWAVLDSRVFDQAGYERHWSRLAQLFTETLT